MLNQKTMTDLQKQHQLAAEWHAEMAAKGTAFQVETRYIGPLICRSREWVDYHCPQQPFADWENRRKPEPKLVPWTFEDVLNHPEIAGAWFRTDNKKCIFKWLAFTDHVIMVDQVGCLSWFLPEERGGWKQNCILYSALMRCEYSTDLKTWHPCGKVVNE